MKRGRSAGGHSGPLRFLEQATRGARARWRAVRALGQRLDALRSGWLTVPVARLRGLLLEAPGMESVLLDAAPGRLRIAFETRDGLPWRLELGDPRIVFAPGGAKELSVPVLGRGEGDERGAEVVVAAIGAAVASSCWPWLAARPGLSGGLVERDSADRWRIDLRTIPAVRELLVRGGGPMVELVQVAEARWTEAGLQLRLRLPIQPGGAR